MMLEHQFQVVWRCFRCLNPLMSRFNDLSGVKVPQPQAASPQLPKTARCQQYPRPPEKDHNIGPSLRFNIKQIAWQFPMFVSLVFHQHLEKVSQKGSSLQVLVQPRPLFHLKSRWFHLPYATHHGSLNLLPRRRPLRPPGRRGLIGNVWKWTIWKEIHGVESH